MDDLAYEQDLERCRARGVRLVPHATPLTTEPMMHVIPDLKCGMDADLQAEIRRQVPVTGSFSRGRTYTWHRDRTSTWEELHWEVARTLKRGAGSFYITFQDQPMHLDRVLPQIPQGPMRIGLRTGWKCTSCSSNPQQIT